MGIQDLVSSLGDNPYFGAGFGLFGLGAGAAILRRASMMGMILFRRHYMTTLEVPCRDKSYQWVLQWITLKGAKNTQHLSVDTKFKQTDSGKIATRHDFIPSIGEHFFWFGGTWIKVERTREQRTMDLEHGTPWEILTITAIGKQRRLFSEILTQARDLAVKENEGKTIMYTAMGSEWRPFGHPRNPRPISSVVLDIGVSSKIVSDVKEFMENPSWYSDRGIPYRRGYLLHGPPGCGKSSFITALAGELQLGICVLNLSERGLSDDRLNHLLAVAPESSIILLEDIDSAFTSREENAEAKSAYAGLSRLTFSGLLNCLDGVASTEARIVFMTTNYPERLDPALIRPGRVDVKTYIGHCTAYQLEAMFNNFYPRNPSVVASQFSEMAKSLDLVLSPATVQGHFMMHKEDPLEAIKDLIKLKNNDTLSNSKTEISDMLILKKNV